MQVKPGRKEHLNLQLVKSIQDPCGIESREAFLPGQLKAESKDRELLSNKSKRKVSIKLTCSSKDPWQQNKWKKDVWLYRRKTFPTWSQRNTIKPIERVIGLFRFILTWQIWSIVERPELYGSSSANRTQVVLRATLKQNITLNKLYKEPTICF